MNKKYIFAAAIAVSAVIALGSATHAQMMPWQFDSNDPDQGGMGRGMMWWYGSTSTAPQAPDPEHAKEIAAGEALWAKLQAKEASCASLNEEDYEALGEFFMERMQGAGHAAMEEMMERMMGEERAEAMHTVMGKRLSGCDPKAAPPDGFSMMDAGPWAGGMMPMMGGGPTMMGPWGTPAAGLSPWGMMSWPSHGWGLFGIGSWLFVVLVWALLIVGAVALVKWLIRQARKGGPEKSPLEILKERYARGEVDRKEFEETAQDLKKL